MPRSFRLLSSISLAAAILAAVSAAAAAQQGAAKPGEPSNAKARKTWSQALEWEQHGNRPLAIDSFRKANKQDGGHCSDCLDRAYTLAMQIGDYKTAEKVIADWLPAVNTDADRAALHLRLGLALEHQGDVEKKEQCFAASCDELKTALTLNPALADAHYVYGLSLAQLHQDDAARAQFASFLAQDQGDADFRARAQRYVGRPELARLRMAPVFEVTTLDGKSISIDSLQGKVVLIDFWATWCGPCRQALPHLRKVVERFQGQPFVALSISLDNDEAKWKDFVAKNGMTWPQYRDGGFDGPIATMFGVRAIPATFSIDADGVLEDQHVGDADIEGKLKKLIAQAVERDKQRRAADANGQRPSGGQ